MSAPRDNPRQPSAPLPDFCSLPVLFALLVVGALTVTLMWLAPGNDGDLRDYSIAVLFTSWLSVLLTVALCKVRPWMQRLPGLWPYAAVWLLLVTTVGASAAVLGWIDHNLAAGLSPASRFGFVRDCMLATGLLGAGLLRYFDVVAQWQVRVAAAAQAQVAALQARIRPHFLFNSMNAVAALIRVDPDAAERTVENLSELFRAALGSDQTSVTWTSRRCGSATACGWSATSTCRRIFPCRACCSSRSWRTPSGTACSRCAKGAPFAWAAGAYRGAWRSWWKIPSRTHRPRPATGTGCATYASACASISASAPPWTRACARGASW